MNETIPLTSFLFVNRRSENNAVYIVLLVILSVGLLGNLLSLFIWTAITTSKSPCKKNLHGRSRLFSILCISDTCAVVSFMVAFSYKVQNDATGWCHFHIYLTVGVVFALFSEMVIIAIGIQRLASLLCPFHAKAKCSLVRQWAALVGLFLLNLLFRVPFAIWRVGGKYMYNLTYLRSQLHGCFLAQIANAILMANELTVPVELVYCVDSVFVLTVTVNVIFYPNFSAKFRDKMTAYSLSLQRIFFLTENGHLAIWIP
nr:hypothetical protein BaRGS_033893 [Batillaria attramentaria]